MKCSRPVGLVLVTLVTMTCSMPSDTTPRYISQGYHKLFSSKILAENSYHSVNYRHTSTHFSDKTTNDPFNSHENREGKRKAFTKVKTRKHSVESSSKINGTGIFNVKPSKVNVLKITPSSSNDRKSPASKDRVRNEATTKAPFRIKVNNANSQITPSLKVTTPTPTKFVAVRTKITTPKIKIKQSTHTINISNISKTTASPIKSRKPTVKKVVTKWSDTTDLSEIKQNWYEEGVPYPNPNPEISSSSPSFSLNDLSSISPLSSDSVNYVSNINPMPEVSSHSPPYFLSNVPEYLPDVPSASDQSSVAPEPIDTVSNPLSVFNLDMIPDDTKSSEGIRSPCPSVHISSSVLNPQQRQECSDLNLVINSHIHQNGNVGGTRNPAISTYDSQAPVEDAISAAAEPIASDPIAADPGVANTGIGAPQAAIPSPGSGGTGGSGGSGGSGGNGDNGPWKFPDLKHLFEAIGYLWNGLGNFFSFLRNPYLYIIPAVLFFLLGFFKVLALFPWWIPILLLYLGVKKNKPKQTISFYKHVHKPVHHADGWFWNHRTKTWQNVQDFTHKKRQDFSSIDYDASDSLSKDLSRIHKIYSSDTSPIQTWKVRKRERRSSPLREYQKITKNNILDVDTTSVDVLDVRTPPKIRQQLQNKLKQKEEIENSHAGVAIPIDETSVKLEETTKKLNFYKIERPTTDSGLSTWILLSGNSSPPPTKPPSKNTVAGYNYGDKSKENSTTILRNPEKIVKPIFRKRTPVTTEKTSRPPPTATTPMHDVSKLTKVKASELNKAVNKKNNTAGLLKKSTTVSNSTKKSTTPSHLKISTTTEGVKNSILKNSTDLSSSSLSVEPKEGDANLSNSDAKKKKNPSKRKKNKNRRRKPVEKNENNTSVSKPSKVKKEKPISTQLYNYLSREIMPTVGVGLVGLMVTAGLASYFLYPFGIARRSYEIDRKDKEGKYFYNNDYSNGIPEEEAIGKVIAGMPSNSDSMASNSYTNTRYRLVDRRAQIKPQPYEGVMKGSVEDVPLTFDRQDQDNTYSSNYQTLDYSTNLDDKKFVVGNIPEELEKEVTPVSVPEHGPRNLKVPTTVESVNKGEKIQERVTELRPAFGPRSFRIRRKRSGISNEIEDLTPIEPIDDTENEFIQKIEKKMSTTTEDVTTESQITTTEVPSTTTEGFPQKFASFFDLMQDLIQVKARLSLQILQNASQSFSRYISRAQARLDEHIRTRVKKD